MKKRYKLTFGLLIIFSFSIFYPFSSTEPIQYVDRDSGAIKVEKVPGEFWLNWLYNNPMGELSLHYIAKRKALSDWYGKRMDSPESADKIASFVEDYEVDLSIAKKQEFISFNDFFYRELKKESRPIDTNTNVVISPADGKVLAYNNIDNQDFIIKGYRFDLKEYLLDQKLAAKYKNGSLLIFRLCPTDYHRFHFPISGNIHTEATIEGDYYSVSPIAIREKISIFCMNKRSYVEMQNPQFGSVIVSEVGATLVGSIIQTYIGSGVDKGDEKGYFKFGGSTVVLIFEKGKIVIDKDLIENTQKGLETAVIMGEKIGKRANN